MGLGPNKTPKYPSKHLAMARPGYVYAFSTPSMPGIVKIGATDRDPSLRLAEANAGTWSAPEPYVIACAVAVDDAFATERAIHALLAARRVNPRREFFRLTDAAARALFAVVAPDPPESEAPECPAPATSAHVHTPADPIAAPSPACAHHALPQGAQRAPALPVTQLRAWVDEHYTRISLREKDTGTKLGALYAAYTAAVPPVHAKLLGRNMFAQMLERMYVGVGPHRGSDGCKGLYLLQ